MCSPLLLDWLQQTKANLNCKALYFNYGPSQLNSIFIMISSMIRKKCGLLLSGMAMLGRGEPHYAWFGTSPKTEAVTSKKWTECKDQTCCDVAVIGGGSGGISFAFEASKLGLQTVLFDYVKESSHGTRWGIGGTCVNVGCIPKKLIHQATIHGEAIKNSKDYGWELGINSEEEAPKLV